MESCREVERWGCFTVEPRALPRGIDVQLALEDIVDDRLTQIIHDVSVPMLQGQSVGERTEEVKA